VPEISPHTPIKHREASGRKFSRIFLCPVLQGGFLTGFSVLTVLLVFTVFLIFSFIDAMPDSDGFVNSFPLYFRMLNPGKSNLPFIWQIFVFPPDDKAVPVIVK
jgi:hypothetical protein